MTTQNMNLKEVNGWETSCQKQELVLLAACNLSGVLGKTRALGHCATCPSCRQLYFDTSAVGKGLNLSEAKLSQLGTLRRRIVLATTATVAGSAIAIGLVSTLAWTQLIGPQVATNNLSQTSPANLNRGFNLTPPNGNTLRGQKGGQRAKSLVGTDSTDDPASFAPAPDGVRRDGIPNPGLQRRRPK